MNITTMDIIKVLPFDEAFKRNLLNNFEKLSADQQYAIEDVVWDTYDALCKLKLEANLQTAMERAKKDEEKLDNEFYKRVKKQTENELLADFSQSLSAIDLSETRETLKKVQEIAKLDKI